MCTNSFVRKMTALSTFFFLSCLLFPAHPLDAQYAEFPQENAWFEATPPVIWCGDASSDITLEVHIVGRDDVRRLWLTNLMFPDDPEAARELFDDGTNGDETGGDNVFSLTTSAQNIPCDLGRLSEYGGFSKWNGFIRVQLLDGAIKSNYYPFAVGVAHPDYRDAFEVEDLGAGLSATRYAFFIEDTGYEIVNDYPVAELRCGQSNFVAFQRFYSVMPDDFDFALVTPGMQLFRTGDLAENTPYEVNVSNNVQHIGMNIFDNTALFGSGGRLRSVIYHSFGDLAIMDHELGHAWAATIGSSLDLLDSEYTDSNLTGHWDEMADVEGQMGSYYFTATGEVGHFSYQASDGLDFWKLTPNTEVEPYSPLELYVMGLIPPEQVPPIHILADPDLSNRSQITAESVTTVTIDQIIEAEGGERSPSFSESPKDFTMAVIVIQDQPYNDAAYAYFSLLSHHLMNRNAPLEHSYFAPFYWATGGRGTLNTTLPLDLAIPPSLDGESMVTPRDDATPGAITEPTALPEPATELAPAGAQEQLEAGRSPICGGAAVIGIAALLPVGLLYFRKKNNR